MGALPPGPTSPPLAQTAHWLLAPLEFMDSCARRYGDAFSVNFLGFQSPMVMLSNPQAIRALYAEREQLLPPGRAVALRPIMGPQSLLLLQGEEHLERRRVMLPPFHGERLRGFEDQMREIAGTEIAMWPADVEVELLPRTRAIALEVILRLVFGVSEHSRLQRLRGLLPSLLDSVSSVAVSFRVLLARRLGRPDPLEGFARLRREIDEILLEDIATRRATGAERGGDVLSLLLDARFEDGSAMSDRELSDQLVTLLIAGHETTATALAWTFDLLTHEPPALARLAAEVRAGEEDRYLRAVVAEALRLRPVVPISGRTLAHELRCGELTLPAGTDVTPAIWLTHTRADLYPEPLEFRPERFLEESPATYAWIPFGGGVRRCLGAAFAELEMRVVIASVLERFDLRAARRHRERVLRRGLTLAPRHGSRVRLRPYTRSDQASPRSSSADSTRGSAATVRRQEPSAL
ncbi:MAG TPA: cytochrome P450 [Solirubrobacteraceae bacterium]